VNIPLFINIVNDVPRHDSSRGAMLINWTEWNGVNRNLLMTCQFELGYRLDVDYNGSERILWFR
jgi:hypothetical protein